MAKKKKGKSQNTFDTSRVLKDFLKKGPLEDQHRVLHQLVKENDRGKYGSYYDTKLLKLSGGSAIAQLSIEEKVPFIEALTEQLIRIDGIANEFRRLQEDKYNLHHTDHWHEIWGPRSVLFITLRDLIRKKLPLTEQHAYQLCRWINGSNKGSLSTYLFPVSGVVKVLQNVAASETFSEKTNKAVTKLIKQCRDQWNAKELRKWAEKLEELIGAAPDVRIIPGEAWSDVAISDLDSMNDKKRNAWSELLCHCQSATQGKPNNTWLQKVTPLFKAVGKREFIKRVSRWLPLVDRPRTKVVESWSQWQPDPNQMLIDENADLLKGLAWCCSLNEDQDVSRLLTALAISAYRKVPGVGPRAVKVGNACVYALGAMPGMHGVAQLAILKVRVKFGTAQKGIEKALVATAERVGIPRDELEEMSVPAYGLDEVGGRTELLGDITAKLVVVGRKTELQWFKADGKQQKTVPASVKSECATELKELKQAGKDIQKMLPAQSARIEQLYLQEKSWTLPTWQERYLDHPLVGTLARRLIWRFKKGRKKASAIWSESGFVDAKGKPIDWLDETTSVQLWHPLDETNARKVTDWRDWLMENEIRQPFKQAHREIYLLTDAERNTDVYSNRFAAHVLKQHQFNALCGARGWKNTLRLLVDDEFPPAHLKLPNWSLRAEFWIEGAGDDYGTDTNESGTFYYLTTDQVRFYSEDAAINSAHASGGRYRSWGADGAADQPLRLDEIPALPFSEVMRDVDLFVGVASVGNDPNWNDGGPEGRYREYWQSFSFGELSATAGTRKAVLERLIPRLKIANQCSFSERFLIVKGSIRTYKIHLGSGNILMEPNDQYLCIVPKQSVKKGADGLFLPFEGDATMSIILSKALLLADDSKIKDSTIVSQIKSS